jgi:site-specific recombinase XerD
VSLPEVLPEGQALVLYAASKSGAVVEALRDFFIVELRNPSTRKTYWNEIRRLADFCAARRLPIEALTPRDLSLYAETDTRRPRTVNTGLSAIRSMFDFLCQRGLLIMNPAARVKNHRVTIDEGATPILLKDEVRRLLESIPEKKLIDLRDRAIVGMLHYSLCRTGALHRLDRGDYFVQGLRPQVRLREKRGHEFYAPVPPELSLLLDRYLEAAAIPLDSDPLFQSSFQGGRRLTGQRLHPNNLTEMLQRRALAAGLDGTITAHVFRATSITEFLDSGGRLEEAQQLARHKYIWTTQIYDRRKKTRAYGEIWRLSLAAPEERTP